MKCLNVYFGMFKVVILASKDDKDMTLMSGASASLFTAITKGSTPMDMLRELVLENEIYDNVKI